MRLTAIGNFNVHSYACHWQGIKLALAQTDYEVQYLDFRELTQPKPRKVGDYEYSKEGIDEFCSQLKAFSPDVVLYLVRDALNNQTLELAKEDLKAFTAFWFCDIRHPDVWPLMGRLDLLAMTSAGMLEHYREAWMLAEEQTVWMPQACLPLKQMEHLGQIDRDIFFIGSALAPEWHQGRRVLLSEINVRYGKRLVWVDPLTDAEKAVETELLPYYYQTSKVSWGHSDPTTYGYHSNRLFLAIGNGGFYFCNHFPGIEVLFEPGQHLATFTSSQDMLEGLERWLKDDREREKIRQAGLRHAQFNHTYLHRVPELLNCIEKRM